MRALLIVPLLLVALLAGSGALSPAPASAVTTPTVSVDTYVADVKAMSRGLTRFGNLLKGVTSVKDLRRKAPAARRALRDVDRYAFVLSRYTVEEPELDAKRRRLSAATLGATDVLSQFLDAAIMGQQRRANAMLPKVLRSLNRISAAVK